MLGKIIKHDLIATSRYFIPTICAFLILSVVNKITFDLGIVSSTDNDFITIASIALFSIYILCIVALYILCYVFITMHFYKTMSGEQGYLTHTLPLRKTTVINGKLLVAAIWQAVISILIFASLGLLAVGHVDSYELHMALTQFNIALTHISGNVSTFWLILCITWIFGLFASPLMFYASIAFGHLFRKQKVAGAVISFIIIYIVMQVASMILMVVTGYLSITKNNFGSAGFASTYNQTLIYSNLLSLAFTIAFYVITNYIFTKKLNLE